LLIANKIFLSEPRILRKVRLTSPQRWSLSGLPVGYPAG